MKRNTLKFLVIWLVCLFLGTLIFIFLHECGHGFGAQLDGVHVSTGFNQVGGVGMRPSDSNFRSSFIEEGILNSSSLLGPATNWLFAIVFTAILLRTKNRGKSTLVLGAIAICNALNRILALLPFFIGALFHKIILADELEWGLRAVKGLNFPMSFNEFKSITKTNPMLILSEPRIYFWTTVSLIISVICFYFAIKQMFKLYNDYMNSKLSKWFLGLMPLIAYFIAIIPMSYLDNLIRINW